MTLPHICLIILDSVRAANTTWHGYRRPTTPFLAELAGRSLTYQHAYAPANWSVPSHTSLFTGIYAGEHGLTFDPISAGKQANPALQRLPLALAAAGYRSEMHSQNVLVSGHTGLTDGFDEQIDYWGKHWQPRYQRTVRNRLTNYWVRRVRRRPFPYQRGWSMRTEDTLATLLTSLRGADQPLFLCANLMDAHMPYTAPIDIMRQFVGGDPSAHFEAYRDIRPLEHNRGALPVRPADQAEKTKLYDASIRHLDERLRAFVTALQQDGLWSNTLFIVTADHGEMFGEHDGVVGHGPRVYQQLVHIPLLIVSPNHEQSRVLTRPVSLVDIFPTLLAHAGLTPADLQPLSGHDLFDFGAKRDYVFSEYGGNDAKEADDGADPARFSPQTAVISADYKFIAWKNGADRLYHLAADPGEASNVIDAPAHGPAQARLTAALKAWRANRPQFAPVDRDDSASDPQIETQLRALGYIE